MEIKDAIAMANKIADVQNKETESSLKKSVKKEDIKVSIPDTKRDDSLPDTAEIAKNIVKDNTEEQSKQSYRERNR